MLTLIGYDTELPSWRTTVTARKPSTVLAARLVTAAEPSADHPTPATLELRPKRDLDDVHLHLRGLDGVTLAGETTWQLAKALAGAPLQLPLTAHVPKGSAGFVVLDVHARRGGQRVSTSRPFLLGEPGAQPTLRTPGRLERGDDGRSFVVMITDR